MKLVLDTSAYSAFNRGDERLRKFFTADNEILVPLIVVGELRAGFAAGNKRAENEKLLRYFLDSPNVSLLDIKLKTTEIFADEYLKLRKAGTPIGTNDLWIASMCIENDLSLLTLDQDFVSVKVLKCATL